MTFCKWGFLLLLTLITFSAQSQTSPLYFTEYPALNPDGQVLYFTYDGDIWKVATNGGTAERVTAMDGIEKKPKISPDGKWLTFSSEQYGNEDIYLLPVSGGKAKQLTFHQANDVVSSWSWDSQWIYFTSGRYNTVSTYKVDINGGTPIRIFSHYFNTIHNLFPDPITGEIFFNYSWESYMFATRRGYKGAFNPDIQSYNPKTKKYKIYTDWMGKDFGATIDRQGHLYFVSDEGNDQMNLYTFKDGVKTPLTQFKEMVIHPSVNANGGTIVFEKGYQLWAYDIATDKAHVIPIKGFRHNTLTKRQNFDVKGNISAFDVSPDNKKLAFVSKGRLFVSDIKGKFLKELTTLPNERVIKVQWLKDNKTLLYNQTWHGFTNWFRQSADGAGKEIQLTADSSNNRMLSIGPKSQKAVYLRGRTKVCIMNLKTFQSKVVATDELWGFQNDAPSFSPDGKYVMFTARRNFETDIMLCRLSDHKVFNLTQTGVSERSPVFSPDGQYLYFISDRTHPSYPYGTQDAHLYRLKLQNTGRPFRSDKFEALFKDKKQKNKNKKDKGKDKDKSKEGMDKDKKQKDTNKEDMPKVKIDFNDLMGRIARVGPSFGQQKGVYVIQDGDKQIVLFVSNHDGGRYKLWQLTMEPFEEDKTDQIGSVPSAISKSSDHYYTLVRGDIYKLNTGSHKASKIDMIHFTFYKNLKQTFEQMFREVWANLDENYYNENFNGVDWEAICERYAGYLPYLHSRTDLRRLLHDMLGELNTSHYGFYSSGSEERNYYNSYTAETGLVFYKNKPYTIKKVLPESPAAYDSVNLKTGDQLIAVNHQPVNKSVSRARYFTFPDRPNELSMTFLRGTKKIVVKVHPEPYQALKDQLYNNWIAQNAKMVTKKSKGRIGYVYMKNMSAHALYKFKLDMVSDSVNRAGLILDLRYNTGGNVHDKVLQFLSQRPYLQWKYRGGKMSPQPDFAPAAKPIVLLVNQQTLSDGEMTAAGFKALDLGTVVGTDTYGWIIFTSSKSLVDGSHYRLPSWGCYTLSGNNLEKTGVTPDIYIDNTFTDRLAGKDPQLNKAISIIMGKLKSKK